MNVRLTKTTIDGLPLPETGTTFVRDTELKGFGLRLSPKGTRAFILEKRINGKVKRITLGRYGELTVQQARQKAQQLMGQIAMGGDPVAEKERSRLQSVTLGEAFEAFKASRKHLKERTLYDYERFMKTVFNDWARWPLVNITKDKVATYHRHLGENHGEYYANGSMRFLRSLFNFALANYEEPDGKPLVAENPVLRLTRSRSWYRTERRRTVIRVPDLAAWYRGVESIRESRGPVPGTGEGTGSQAGIGRGTGLGIDPGTGTGTSSETPGNPEKKAAPGNLGSISKTFRNGSSENSGKGGFESSENPVPENSETVSENIPGFGDAVADFLLLLLFTGLRRNEAAQLRWKDVDLESRTLTIPDPKNRVPHTLPLSDFVFEMLRHRQEWATSPWVFAGSGKKGYLVEPKKQIQRVVEVSGVQFSIHDLRRTFATVAESLDIAPYTLKRLLNHKQRSDVTAGYIVTDVERMRLPMATVERALKDALGIGETSRVVEINFQSSAKK